MILLEKLKEHISIIPASPQDVDVFVKKHYLHKWPIHVKKIYAVKCLVENKLIGTIIYGSPKPPATKFVEPVAPKEEVLEIKRLFIEDRFDSKNMESFVISHSLKLIKQEFPSVKIIITFADESQGHMGTIYQATNAIYLGKSGGKHKYAYILRGNLKALQNLLQNKLYPKLK